MIEVKTQYPFAVESPDFLSQQQENLKLSFSAAADNTTNLKLVRKIGEYFSEKRKKPISELRLNCLDLGCAGGQFILDLANQEFTDVCVGLDGVAGSLGRYNWLTKKDIFFNADLSKEYEILNEKGVLKFDLITSWEVIEHLHVSELDTFFKTMHKHLAPDGTFIGSIAMFSDTRDANGYVADFHLHRHHYDPTTEQFVLHQSVFDEKTWRDEILKEYRVEEYPFKDSSCGCGYLALNDHTTSPTGRPGSYYLMIEK